MRRAGTILLLLGATLCIGAAALDARADIIVLKNGRRISAARVEEENGRVSYETSAGRFSFPRTIVERIERGGGLAPEAAQRHAAATLPITPPPVEPAEGYDEVAHAAVHDASIDRDYIAGLENSAPGGGAAAAMRVAVAHHAAAQFELRRGDLEQPIAHYRRALTFAPEQPVLLLNTAYLHLRRSEYTAALYYLERARRVAP